MKYTADYQPSTDETPKALLYLIIATGAISALSTLFNGIFIYFFGSFGPENWLGLSWYGIQNFYLWQPFTYLFTQNSEGLGISISYLISLSINLYILWLLGSSIIERIGLKSFFKLYFISGIFAGLVALIMMKLTSQFTDLSGPGSSLLALLTFWTLLYSEADLKFFFLFQFKAKWLTAAIFIGIILSCISQLDFVSLGLYLTGMLCGYLYGVLIYDLKGPFAFLTKFEDFVTNLFAKKSGSESGKIIDINTGRALDDEIFVDQMLAKISKSGEDSLTFYERRRLDEISKRKR